MNKTFWFGSLALLMAVGMQGCFGGSSDDSGSGGGGSLTCRGSNGDYDLCLDYVGSQYTQITVEALCESPLTFSTESCADTQNSLSRVGYCQYFAGTSTEIHHVYYGTAGGTVGQILCTEGAGGVWIDETL
jgi:hypothetical protein